MKKWIFRGIEALEYSTQTSQKCWFSPWKLTLSRPIKFLCSISKCWRYVKGPPNIALRGRKKIRVMRHVFQKIFKKNQFLGTKNKSIWHTTVLKVRHKDDFHFFFKIVFLKLLCVWWGCCGYLNLSADLHLFHDGTFEPKNVIWLLLKPGNDTFQWMLRNLKILSSSKISKKSCKNPLKFFFRCL